MKAGFLPCGTVGLAQRGPARPLGCRLPRGPRCCSRHPAACSLCCVVPRSLLSLWGGPWMGGHACLDLGSPQFWACLAQSPCPAPPPTCPHASWAWGCSLADVCSLCPASARGPRPRASPDPALLQQACWVWRMMGTSSPWSSTMGTLGGSPSRTSASCHPTIRSSVSGGLGPSCPLTSRKPGLWRGDASSRLPRLVRVRTGTLTQNCQGSRAPG